MFWKMMSMCGSQKEACELDEILKLTTTYWVTDHTVEESTAGARAPPGGQVGVLQLADCLLSWKSEGSWK